MDFQPELMALYQADNLGSFDFGHTKIKRVTVNSIDNLNYTGTLELSGWSPVQTTWNASPVNVEKRYALPGAALSFTFEKSPSPQNSPANIHFFKRLVDRIAGVIYENDPQFKISCIVPHMFIARHGHYACDEIITARGREALETLAADIKPHSDCFGIVCTDRKNALEAYNSASILSGYLKTVSSEEAVELYSNLANSSEIYIGDIEAAIRACSAPREADGLVIVTSMPMAQAMSRFIQKYLLETDEEIRLLDRGEGYHLDLMNDKVEKIPKKKD